MRGVICYYSGSGNTKLACQYIAKGHKKGNVVITVVGADGA